MVSGSCLCGAVQFVVDGRLSPIQFDHCSRCRKSSGSAFAAEIVAEAGALRWTQGSEHVRRFEAPVREFAPGYRRVFCGVCGGPLPISGDERVLVPAGTLDSDLSSRPARHIFVGVKAPWFEIADVLPQFDRNVPADQRW